VLTARIDPTDRSIPPVRITNVIPTDTMPTIDICCSRLGRLDIVRKFGTNIEVIINTTTIIAMIVPFLANQLLRRRAAPAELVVAAGTSSVC
jgi:hypothetical protein